MPTDTRGSSGRPSGSSREDAHAIRSAVYRYSVGVGMRTECGCDEDVKRLCRTDEPNNVDILHTKPNRPFRELGAVSTSGWKGRDTAKMHNAFRAKSAPLGADAVIILQSGIDYVAPRKARMWATGVAIKYEGDQP